MKPREQPGRVGTRRGGGRLPRKRESRQRLRSGGRSACRRSGEAHELSRDLEVAILVAQAFELEAKDAAGEPTGISPDGAAALGRDPLTDAAADHRQRLFRSVLQNAAQRAARVRTDERADGAADLREEIAEELFQLLLVPCFAVRYLRRAGSPRSGPAAAVPVISASPSDLSCCREQVRLAKKLPLRG